MKVDQNFVSKAFKASIQSHSILGEYIGTVKAIIWWDIPEELKIKLEEHLKNIQAIELVDLTENIIEDNLG